MSATSEPPPPGSAPTKTAHSVHSIAQTLLHPSETDVANVRIMTAAFIVLLAVIVFILGLHLYAKWFWRTARLHRRTYQLEFSLEEALESEMGVGLDKAVFESLPTFIYSWGLMNKGVDCAVCLCEFEEKESGRLLPMCNHMFHTECIGMWFKSHSTCPLCRLSVLPPTVKRLDLHDSIMNSQSSGAPHIMQMTPETVPADFSSLPNSIAYEESACSLQQPVAESNDQQEQGIRNRLPDVEAPQSPATTSNPRSPPSFRVVSPPGISGSDRVTHLSMELVRQFYSQRPASPLSSTSPIALSATPSHKCSVGRLLSLRRILMRLQNGIPSVSTSAQ
ncbi:hypothetical protein O6H91_06G093400 [Diphasiastrum complanatum]|uniref:Uncharacterized protein n=1 Tax=Diphasiastrum complanatum TaxID=34168 RepID=A0ACC2DGN8_DIPCM|nr:hypothetical protein O6H91_06G093400 [Diphasiastrum complanatum]